MVSPGQNLKGDKKISTQSNQMVSARDNLLVALMTHGFKFLYFVLNFSL